MATQETRHITPVEGGAWAVKLDEDSPASGVYPTEGQAIAGVYELLPGPGETEVIVHDPAGGIRSSLRIRRYGPSVDPAEDDDPAARAEAHRLTPSSVRLEAGIGKYPPPPGNFDEEEMPY